MRQRISVVRTLGWLLLMGPAIATIMGFGGAIHPGLDTVSNFIWHFAIAAICGGLIFIFLRWRISGVLSLIVGAAGLYVSTSAAPAVDAKLEDAKTYTLLHLNLYFRNPTPQKVLDLVEHKKPDIVFFNEFSREWQKRLTVLDRAYPHQFHCPEWNQLGGSKIWSKFPLLAPRGVCHSYAALALQKIELEGQEITLGSVHLRWPWPASGPKQVRAMRPMLQRLGENALLAGDYNSAPWTNLVQSFARYGRLEIVDEIGKTWMYRSLPARWAKTIGLPIDNVMRKGAVKVISARTLAPVGSDHLPIWTIFSIEKTGT